MIDKGNVKAYLYICLFAKDLKRLRVTYILQNSLAFSVSSFWLRNLVHWSAALAMRLGELIKLILN